MTQTKQYAGRDHMELDRDGNYYCRHVAAMTAEGLHAKSDIAAELAWRDREIDRLRSALSARASAGEGGLQAEVKDAALGVATIHVDQSYFGPHMIGPGKKIRIFVDTTAPQPAQAGASGGGEWGDWLESQSDDDLLTIFAFRPDLAERLRAIIATPPAHGDGEEGERDDFWNAVCAWTWKHRGWSPAKCQADELRAALTTRPTPDAQEARDAARLDWCASKLTLWNGEKHVPATRANIDAALALPAQGEGK